MAISVKAQGTWLEVTADAAVTIPGTPVAGDRMYLFAAWKPFGTTAQITSPQAWTEITEFADGAVADGNGVGSVKVAAYYRDWVSGDGNPTLDLSAAVVGAAVIVLLAKGAAEAWDTPTFVTAAITAVSPWAATSSGTITIKTASIVLHLIGLRDDSAAMTRSATTALEDDGTPNVTWNGNVVETVATHFTTTTGNDFSADLIHRLVTTGAVGVNLTSTGTPSAAETGAALWVHQGITDTAYTALIQALTPTGYWPLDDVSGNARDASGNSRPGTAGGSLTYLQSGPTINGGVQSAIAFVAETSRFEIAESIDDGVAQFTISLWLRSTSANDGYPVSKRNDADSNWTWATYYPGTTTISTYFYDNAGGFHTWVDSISVTVNDGAWHHYLIWRDVDGRFHGQVDGSTIANDVGLTGSWLGATTAPMVIGAQQGGFNGYTGDLAHVAYWRSDVGTAARTSLFTGVSPVPPESPYNQLLAQ